MDVNERRARATHEATQWWNRIGVDGPGELSRADREQLTEWLRESPLHVAELLRIAHVHSTLEGFKLWDEIETGTTANADNVVSIGEMTEGLNSARDRAVSPDQESDGPDRGAARRSRVRLWAMAASTCLVAIIGSWLALGNRGQVIETDLAERRQVMLDDGSVVQLEPETRLRVRFEDHERHVALDRGRALFRVAKDARRPFSVNTDETSVRAVGTAFGVERGRRGVIVTVAEGKVAVGRTRDGDSGRAAWSGDERGEIADSVRKRQAGSDHVVDAPVAEVFLTAGQQLTVQSSGVAERVRAVDTTRELAWSQGRLVFDNDTLADVLEEFNSYNRTQLSISDRDLAARRVSGVFEATDTETLLAFIRHSGGGISITQTDDGIVIAPSAR